MTPTRDHKNGRSYHYYVCLNAVKRGRQTCLSKSLPVAAIDDWVLEQIQADPGSQDATGWPGAVGENALAPQERSRWLRSRIQRVDYDGARDNVAITLQPAEAERVERAGENPCMTASRIIRGQFKLSGKGRALCKIIPGEGRVPRIARLMALGLRFDTLIRERQVIDYGALARLGHVSRARLTQIMNLLMLAPPIIEEILFLPPRRRGRDPIRLARLQPIALTWNWKKQRRLWKTLCPSQGNAQNPSQLP